MPSHWISLTIGSIMSSLACLEEVIAHCCRLFPASALPAHLFPHTIFNKKTHQVLPQYQRHGQTFPPDMFQARISCWEGCRSLPHCHQFSRRHHKAHAITVTPIHTDNILYINNICRHLQIYVCIYQVIRRSAHSPLGRQLKFGWYCYFKIAWCLLHYV